ncbi:MAG TPA: SMC-Scp complex subunit ScpB [Syntrophomonadaceae bacterium]|jgi:segregation and condensation protein B|nr:SMC-Scp complex subunit ScpB [Syntrophomonadaceae bacterium]HPU48133.1 SMC-Scp complex subunit ScpB [Syntrophomonadaceae bacterium]
MRDEVKAAVEAILFMRGERVGTDELVEILDVPMPELRDIMRELIAEYFQPGRGLQIVPVDDGYLMCTKKEYSDILARAARPIRRRLSQAALETLALIAYRQPITRAEIEKIRGVKVDRVINNLLERGLIEEVGVKDTVGKPILYGTTAEFLRLYGLTSLKDLPPLEE